MSQAMVWFRQDLRIQDNPALSAACNQHDKLLLVYVYDDNIQIHGEAQAWWLYHSLKALEEQLKGCQQQLCFKKGDPLTILEGLVQQYDLDAVYWNRAYQPQVIERDSKIKAALQNKGVHVQSFNGSLLQEPWQVKNKTGGFYKVFTPYWKQCLSQIEPEKLHILNAWPKAISADSDLLDDWRLLPKAPDWASKFANYWQVGEQAAAKRLEDFLAQDLGAYQTARDFPAQQQTSRLSMALHFGEISPKQVWHAVCDRRRDQDIHGKSADVFLSEIGWREFSYYLLYHFPTLAEQNFKAQFDAFPWENDEEALGRWQKGQTGYPIVDAGMRELWETGYMHNRVRMIVASFLTKDLLIDWRKGAAWFFNTLLDADLANNSAGWQWTAGSGADAAPYFRIFNPSKQGERFDPEGVYIKRWLPELRNLSNKYIHQPWQLSSAKEKCNYPQPMIEHDSARKRALALYQNLG